MDPNEKQEMTEIKVKLPNGTNYQMVPFQTGSNEDYVAHIIATKQLLEQKEIEEDVEKAFGVVPDIRDDKLGPLYKTLKMSKFSAEKEELKKQTDSVKEDVLKVKKEAQGKIVKAYKLNCVYFIGKAQTQRDKVVSEMHGKDPWVTVNGTARQRQKDQCA